MYLQEIVRKDLHWTDVAQGRGRLQAVVNAVMKFWFYKEREGFFTREGVLVSR
jgi:hypothetical protein